MKTLFITLLSTMVLFTSVLSASIEQFLPWVAPNSLVFGTTFATFRQERPSATQLSIEDQKAGEPFSGGMSEILPDGSMLMYGFRNDNLESVRWTARPTNKIQDLVRTVRSSLLETCGEPSSGTTGRVESYGSVAQIVWEDYGPKENRDYLISLVATSDGIEVSLMNESAAKTLGIKTTHETYEEVLRAVSSLVQPEAMPSKLVDYLAVARGDAQQSRHAESDTIDRKTAEVPSRPSPKVSASEDKRITSSPLKLPEPPKHALSVRLWLLGGLILGVLVFMANALRKHQN